MPKKSLPFRTDLIQKPIRPDQDLTGQKFGEWTVLEYVGYKTTPWFKCQCSCGHIGVVRSIDLRNGGSKSCGHNGSGYRHGHRKRGSRDPEYLVWKDMQKRCRNPTHISYPHYGERGIKVCERWSGPDGFTNFLADMGKRPTPKHSIDRLDGDADYEPGNCRWATRVQQNRNNKQNILITHDGLTLCLAEWCERLGHDYSMVYDRIYRGRSADEILFGERRYTKP